MGTEAAQNGTATRLVRCRGRGKTLKGFCVLSSAFPIGEGASSRSHPRIMPTLLPARMGDGDGGRNQSETRVSVDLAAAP